MRRRARHLIWIAPLAIVAIAVFIAIGGGVVQWLWNWLLPPLFGAPPVTFWQALGILALCRILVGGFGLRGGSRSGPRRRLADRVSERIADRVGERWDRMSPEERERFREQLRERCGFDPVGGETKAE